MVTLGCSSGSNRHPPTEPAHVGSGEGGVAGDADTAGTGSMAAGGTEQTAGATGGAPTDDGSGGALSHAEGGEPANPGSDAGGDGAVDPTPRETACTAPRAFIAHAGSFVAPTDKALAQALNQDIFDRRPITFVLLGEPEAPRVAASYSQESAGKQAFHAGIAPEPTDGWLNGDAFGTATAQPHAHLLVDTEDGPLEIPLDNLSYTVTTSDACTQGVATVSGVIPASRADLVDQLTGVDSGDPELPDREDPLDTPVSAIFSVELVEFDFGSVP
jgi:hypothetical protein